MNNKRYALFLFGIYILSSLFISCSNLFEEEEEEYQSGQYTITFDANKADSGTVPPGITKTEYEEVVVPENTGNLGRSGYVFMGWNTMSTGNGTTYLPSKKMFMPPKDTRLYALWSKGTYTIDWDAQGAGTPEKIDQIRISGTTTLEVLPGGLEKKGYTFEGWWTEPDGQGTQFTKETTVLSDMTLYAKWTKNKGFTITYHFQNGIPDVVEFVKYEESSYSHRANRPNTPIRNGYILSAWFLNEQCIGEPFDFYTDLQSDLDLYALWIKDEYEYGFDAYYCYSFLEYSGADSHVVVPEYIEHYAITQIVDNCFAGNNKIESITLGRAIDKIYDQAFSGCNSLRVLKVHSPKPPTIFGYLNLFSSNDDIVICVPPESIEKYKADSRWNLYTIESL
ncbi:MAG: InlB B-repeat-containing protein [Spirochaetales bacterium]|nr:InlB B-repeat-containing protein [Spirochaetales bacterium]